MKSLSGCLFLFIMFFTWADSQSLIRVTILDRESRIRRVFENPEDLRYFSDVWEDRVLVPNMKDLETWNYQFDLMTRDKSIRWLYDSHTGFCSFLSKDTMPVYYIRPFAVLNNILAAEPDEKVIWIIEERSIAYWNEPWYDRSGWWKSDRYDHYHDHKKSRDYHDRDYHRSRGHAERDHHYKDKSRDENYRDRNRDDETRRKPIPVYLPKEERRSEPERRPFVVSEKKSSEPPIKVNIDERKLPGIRGIVRD